jgi:hypothetical protein
MHILPLVEDSNGLTDVQIYNICSPGVIPREVVDGKLFKFKGEEVTTLKDKYVQLKKRQSEKFDTLIGSRNDKDGVGDGKGYAPGTADFFNQIYTHSDV